MAYSASCNLAHGISIIKTNYQFKCDYNQCPYQSILPFPKMVLPITSSTLFIPVTFLAIILLPLFLSFSFPSNASAAALGNDSDTAALLEFKSQIIEDPNGVFSSWNSSLHFCKWVGVTCGLKHQRVTGLDLQNQNLVGAISPAIGNLSFLHTLNIGANSFRGDIPQELGRLFRLRSLNLSFNFFEGEIPANLSHCSNLIYLLLDHNYLIGHIPPQLGSLPNLEMLYLKNNNLTGNFPASIGNLTSLRELYLSYNYNLEGEIPDSISQLKNLTVLGLSVNRFFGVFPPPLYNLSSLELLALSFNNFTGNLPENIGLSLPNLQRLYLATNYFVGPIPVSLSNLSQLLQLDIPYNSFTGNVPMSFGSLQNLLWFNILDNNLGSGESDDLSFLTSLTNCSQLQFLDIANNSFGGELPRSVTNLSTQLTRLLIGGNNIHGKIPGEISNLVNLYELSMEETFLTGIIPDSIGKLSNLKRLHLESNLFIGEIPISLGNNTQLLGIYLQNNSLSGTIPPSLANCQSLLTVDLSQNKLNGAIPKQLFSIPSLSIILNVSHNSLTGPLPNDIGNMTNLAALDISNNKFSGDIPSNLGNCFGLQLLFMQGNSFEGTIPSLSGLKNIQFLDLSHNHLSGQIPQSLAKLSSVLYLNLSFNNLEGEVPTAGVFRSPNAIQVSGNKKLCGGVQELKLQPCPIQSPKKPKKHKSLKLILVLTIVASWLALMVCLVSFFCKKKLEKKPHSVSSVGHVHPKISYEELLNATGRFSPSNLIGSGNFGTVYRGVLGPDETIVAVKVLNLQKRGASKSFFAECLVLRNIRHRNLVKILTACSSINFEGNDFKALVYEYMPNGSLEKWLHPEEGQPQQSSLSILKRLSIAIDVASALDYLHNQCQTPVAHCDIKPSNVLLDNDFTAHVSDFGLAQLVCKFSNEATMNQFSSLGIKGTVGYAAPEYGMGSEVSTLGDVYSFGVLLLELFTGRQPTDDLFEDNLNLHNYVKMALPSKVMAIVDQSAIHNAEDTEKITEVGCSTGRRSELTACLVSVFQIGLECSSDSPQDRLNMRNAATELLSIRETFLRSGIHKEQNYSHTHNHRSTEFPKQSDSNESTP